MDKRKQTETTKDLIRKVTSTTQTVPIIDIFEGKSYDRLILGGFFGEAKFGIFYCRYIIERIKIVNSSYKLRKNYPGSITFTELKTNKNKELKKYITEQINKKVDNLQFTEKKEVTLDIPYLFFAQSSKNQIIYGWEWEWGELVSKGNEYGECTPFHITGVRISRYE